MYNADILKDKNKPILSQVKFFLKAGVATVSPPIGPILGQYGVDMMLFCREFNEYSKFIKLNTVVPVDVVIYTDRSFMFRIKKPTVSFLLKCSFYNRKEITRVELLKVIYKISVLKGNVYTNKYFLCKLIYGTFLSLGILVRDQ